MSSEKIVGLIVIAVISGFMFALVSWFDNEYEESIEYANKQFFKEFLGGMIIIFVLEMLLFYFILS